MGPESVREYLLHNLKWRLYADFYCGGGVRPQLNEPEARSVAGNSVFIHALSDANAGAGGREPGWTVVRVDGRQLVVARDGLSLWMAPEEVYGVDGSDLSSGSNVGILMPKELLRLSPGFYMALGNAEFPVDGSIPVLRFYWNLRSNGAARLISALTTRLNDQRLAFRLKVVNEPGRYSRCDARRALHAPGRLRSCFRRGQGRAQDGCSHAQPGYPGTDQGASGGLGAR